MGEHTILVPCFIPSIVIPHDKTRGFLAQKLFKPFEFLRQPPKSVFTISSQTQNHLLVQIMTRTESACLGGKPAIQLLLLLVFEIFQILL